MSQITRSWIDDHAIDNSKMDNTGAYILGSVDATNFTASELVTSVDMTTTNLKVNGIAGLNSLYFSSGNAADFTAGHLRVTGDSTVDGSAMFVDGSFSGNVRIEGTLSARMDSTIFDQLLIDQDENQPAIIVNRVGNITPVVQINGYNGTGTLLEMSGDNNFTLPAIKIHQENTGEDLIISGEDTGGFIGATGDLRIYNNNLETVLFTSAGDMSAANNFRVGGDAYVVGDASITGNLAVTGNVNGADMSCRRCGIGTAVLSPNTVTIKAANLDNILVCKNSSSTVFTVGNAGDVVSTVSISGVDGSFFRVSAGTPNSNHALSVRNNGSNNAAIIATGSSGINLNLLKNASTEADPFAVFSNWNDATMFSVDWNGDMTCGNGVYDSGSIRSFGDLKIAGDSSIDGNSWVGGDTTIAGNLSVLGSFNNVDTIDSSGTFITTPNIVTMNYIKFNSGLVRLWWDATTFSIPYSSHALGTLPSGIAPLQSSDETRRILYGLIEVANVQGVLNIRGPLGSMLVTTLPNVTFNTFEASLIHYYI